MMPALADWREVNAHVGERIHQIIDRVHACRDLGKHYVANHHVIALHRAFELFGRSVTVNRVRGKNIDEYG
jgi:hypothetical protein